jgi:hypothetical protein
LSGNEAVHGVSSASKACRSSFLAGVVSDLVLRCTMDKRWRKTPEEEDAHAATLARLLRRMPGLTWIGFALAMSEEGDDGLSRIVGKAIRRLERPLAHVEEISIQDGRVHCGPNVPHPLAQAIAEGRLPALRMLNICFGEWVFMHEPQNAQLLEQAIQRGHLSQLTILWMKPCPAFDAVLRGFCGMSDETQQRQKHVESIVLSSEDGLFDEEEIELLEAALRLPCLSGLKQMRLGPELFDVVAGYLNHDGGRTALTSLEIEGDDFDLAPLVEALGAGGGAPNLESLQFEGADDDTFEALGAIYSTGGLSKLRELSFTWPVFEVDGLRSFFDGVGAAPHKGEALRAIEINATTTDEEAYTQLEEDARVFKEELEAAQARGIFPNAELSTDIEFDTEALQLERETEQVHKEAMEVLKKAEKRLKRARELFEDEEEGSGEEEGEDDEEEDE